MLPGECSRIIDVLPDSRKAFKILLDHLLALSIADAQSGCQSIGTDTVGNPEVDLLGFPAVVRSDFIEAAEIKNLHGSGCMNVGTFIKSTDHICITRDRCNYTKFYLRIVGRQYGIPLFGDKSFPNLSPPLGTDGNILKIGTGR